MSEEARGFRPPTPLSARHGLEDFRSGEESLDGWLRKRATDNMDLGASRTYVVCPSGSSKVIGYYAICMGQILNQEAIGSLRSNMPRLIPAVILGWLAVDEKWQGKGLGGALLRDAAERSARAAREVSARPLLVHAISPQAEAFYRRHGFASLPTDTPTLVLDLVKFASLPE